MSQERTQMIADLQTIKSQLSEINRRLGNLESDVSEDTVTKTEFHGLRREVAAIKGIMNWVGGTIGSGLILTALAAIFGPAWVTK